MPAIVHSTATTTLSHYLLETIILREVEEYGIIKPVKYFKETHLKLKKEIKILKSNLSKLKKNKYL
jgi:hypothetical protein